MTIDRMALKASLRRDRLRILFKKMIGFVANRIIELDLEGLTGAGSGERSASRLKWRCRGRQDPGVTSVYGDWRTH